MCALEDLKERVLRGGLISAGEAACLCRVPLASLCAAAAEIRAERIAGNAVYLDGPFAHSGRNESLSKAASDAAAPVGVAYALVES